MFGSSTTTTTPAFGGFGASNTTSSTGGGLFGSGATTSAAPSSFGTSTTGGGLFGSTTNNTPSFGGGGLFGSSAAPASTATSAPLFGTAASTSTAPLFGGNTTSAAAPSLFGASNTATSAPSLFGASKPATTTPAPLFGASTTSTTPAFGNTLFSKPAATTTTTNTLFGQPQQQAQQSQQGPLLDLNRCIQDTNVPHFIVQPDKITRTVVPANFFYNNPNTSNHESTIRSKREESNNRSLFDRFTDDKTSLGSNDRGLELPTFLTGAIDPSLANSNNNTPNNMTTPKRRLSAEQQQSSSDRSVLPKKEQGIFSHQNNLTRGFDRRLKNQGNTDVPASEIREVGIVAPTPDILQPYSSSTVPPFNNVEQPFEEKTQVRVFGFASENTDAIIKHFSTLGDLDPKDCISEGNWITFTYKTHADALKAIACNGMLIDQTHLVGVTWYTKAKELSTTLFSQEQDLFTNATGFMNMPINQQKEAVMTREPTFVDRIREKLLGW